MRVIADLSSITARGTDATGPAASLALDLPVAPLGFPSWRLKFLHEVRLIPLCAGFGYALLAWSASDVHLAQSTQRMPLGPSVVTAWWSS